jgi:uncharacterized protein (DUF2141 family)
MPLDRKLARGRQAPSGPDSTGTGLPTPPLAHQEHQPMTRPTIVSPIAALALAFALTGAAHAEGTQADSVQTASATPQAYSLTVTVHGVRSGQGQIMAGLLKADAATGTARSVGGLAAPAVQGDTTLVFTGLEPGTYAVRMFHDENGDGQMATNLFGLPTEGFGFSNGARAGFGPPSFADMQVTVAADATTTATMTY